MSGLEDTDGLCGIIAPGSYSDKQVRCKYKFGHDGVHSYEKTEAKGWFRGIYVHPVEKYTQRKK